MPDIDFGHILQLLALANSFVAAVGAAFAYFGSRRNAKIARETQIKVQNVELLINGHMTARLAAERTIAHAEGMADQRAADDEAGRDV